MKHFPFVAFVIVSVICGISLYTNNVMFDKYVAVKDKYAVALSKLVMQCPVKE